MKLIRMKCVPCEGGVEPLKPRKAKEYLHEVDIGWRMLKGKRISRQFRFRDFVRAMRFVNEVAAIAEREGHHPDMHIERWNHVRVEIYTHAIGGLHENDFILAAKIDRLFEKSMKKHK
ncbi:MAG: 4a-hydroxytetrahydrobiopterin dehydratase [Candidatus Micrarchaeota archaeon]